MNKRRMDGWVEAEGGREVGREAANEVCQGKHKAGRKGRTGSGGEAGSGKQAITAVTISVVIMMSQSAVRRVPRCNCIGSVRLGCLIRGIAA